MGGESTHVGDVVVCQTVERAGWIEFSRDMHHRSSGAQSRQQVNVNAVGKIEGMNIQYDVLVSESYRFGPCTSIAEKVSFGPVHPFGFSARS